MEKPALYTLNEDLELERYNVIRILYFCLLTLLSVISKIESGSGNVFSEFLVEI